jgi:rhodanese-related sulfurtransferase
MCCFFAVFRELLGRMSCLIGRLGRVFMLLFVCDFGVVHAANVDNKKELQCSASSEYLIELTRLGVFSTLEADYSCLTDLPSILQKLPSLQLIDTRQSRPVHNKNTKDAWLIPITELKNKSFLQKKSLLLIGDGFSRVSAARDCAELKKIGFISTKILLGGIDTWIDFKKERGEPSRVLSEVSSQELLFEYFNGQVVLIATSKVVAERLETLGITKFQTVDAQNKQAIIDIVLTQSNNSYDPVVLIGENGGLDIKMPINLPNLYLLSGGVRALKTKIEQNAWANHNRTAPVVGGVCAAQ